MPLANIQMEFGHDFHGVMKAPNGEVKIGGNLGEMEPYHLLFGALGSCFYATFLSVAYKMKLEFEKVSIEIRGSKRDEQIATLEYVEIDMKIIGAKDEKKVRRAAELGAKYCSIHETISQVAQIDLNVLFE